MRASSYIFFADYPDGRSTLLLHGMFGTIDKVDRNVADFLRSGEIDEAKLEKSGISIETLKLLAARGYLTNLSAEEEHQTFVDHATALHRQALRRSLPSFALIPSYRCNLRCFYCFQSHELHEDQRLISHQMVELAFAAVAKFIAKNYGDSLPPGSILFKLWGGEPLLARNRPVIEHIVRKCKENGYILKAITNGTQLYAYLDLLAPDAISHVQITLDGPREIHDRRRTDASSTPTFDTIAGNITEALRRGIEVDLRINVDKTNLESLPALNSYISNQRWNEFPNFSAHMSRISPSEQLRGTALVDRARILKTIEERKDTCSLIRGPNSSIETAVETYFRTGMIPLKTTAYCSASLGYFILDLFGDIYACENEAGQRDKRIGSFGSGEFELNDKLKVDWLQRSVANVPQCSRCPAALLCGGGCAFNARLASGTYFSAYCDGFKSNLARVLPQFFEKHKPSC